MVIKKTAGFRWEFPLQTMYFLRIELVFIALIAALVFLMTFFGMGDAFVAGLLFAIVFLGLYVVISRTIQTIRQVEEHYKISRTHLEVTRKTKKRTKKFKVALKDVVHHKLDKIFLGGYVLTKQGAKHPLFFNTKKELEQFEKILLKGLKK
ncbi:hypothetical protein HOI26_00735 [Candidatus Woesearchaeota archaeon]|jgi:hypothetical protein|nr:hypothetical protein [Candidatus Woesearchaeota archaeon]MBT5739600.1 hypothetical protein [Candidatus Woesearchaeota archaeon]